jgi:N-methylhydantoinase B
LGERRSIRFLTAGEFLSVTKKTKTRPWALAGGHEPEPISMRIFADTPAERRVGTHRAKVSTGDRAVYMTAGGAGYGPPEQRAPEAVLEDVLEGYVSLQAAHDIYRVAIVDGRIDERATRSLRTGTA